MENTQENILISEVAIPFSSRVVEMVTASSIIDVPIHPSIDMSVIIGDDPDPKFVNVEVMRAGVSGNNRRYSNNVVREVNDMIPGAQAFFGHPDPSKHGFEFREPQGIYVGSILEQMENGSYRSIGKCYLFKSSPLREWVPKSIAAGNPMTVSINGLADVVRNGEYLDLVHMTELQSIDWANPGTEGMETSKAMSVVRELQDNTGGMEDMAEPNVKDIIGNVTVTEFKAYNPTGYSAVLTGVTVQELQAANPSLIDQIIESAKVTEMQFTIGGKAETIKVTELQSKFDGYESQIQKLNDDIKVQRITEYKNRKIGELVPENLREKIGARVSGDTEQAIDASLESEMQYVREMGGLNNLPVGSQRQKSDIGIKDAVYTMFGNKPKEDK